MSFLGGPSGSGTSSTPSNNTAQAYQPQAQPQADESFYNTTTQLSNLFPQAYQLGQNFSTNPGTSGASEGASTVNALGTPYGIGQLEQGQQLAQYGLNTLNTAFDPQQGLYNQQSTQNLNNQNAINAMSGVAGTPYGAGVTGQNQQNFNTNWQNQQLQRQATGLQAGGNALTQGATLGNTGLGTILSSSGAPYNTYNTQQANALSGLSQATQVPQQTLGDLMEYMGLGQNASQLSGSLGQMGVNQLTQGMSGIGSLLGMLL